jgi:hypothetical protein
MAGTARRTVKARRTASFVEEEDVAVVGIDYITRVPVSVMEMIFGFIPIRLPKIGTREVIKRPPQFRYDTELAKYRKGAASRDKEWRHHCQLDGEVDKCTDLPSVCRAWGTIMKQSPMTVHVDLMDLYRLGTDSGRFNLYKDATCYTSLASGLLGGLKVRRLVFALSGRRSGETKMIPEAIKALGLNAKHLTTIDLVGMDEEDSCYDDSVSRALLESVPSVVAINIQHSIIGSFSISKLPDMCELLYKRGGTLNGFHGIERAPPPPGVVIKGKKMKRLETCRQCDAVFIRQLCRLGESCGMHPTLGTELALCIVCAPISRLSGVHLHQHHIQHMICGVNMVYDCDNCRSEAQSGCGHITPNCKAPGCSPCEPHTDDWRFELAPAHDDVSDW